MQRTLIKYRTKLGDQPCTTDNRPAEYVVIPNIFVSDLLKWLSDISAEILETTDNVDHPARLPINWPSYETCQYCMAVSDALHCVL